MENSALDENARLAKANWLRIDPGRLRDFIAGHKEVRSVDIVDVQYSAAGAGSSNGIALLCANIDVGAGAERRQLVVRYAPGRTLIKQKSFTDEFLTGRAVHAPACRSPHRYGSTRKATVWASKAT